MPQFLILRAGKKQNRGKHDGIISKSQSNKSRKWWMKENLRNKPYFSTQKQLDQAEEWKGNNGGASLQKYILHKYTHNMI